jgi:hypothetical protein
MLIGEDTKPVHLAFETHENNLGQSVQTFVRCFQSKMRDRVDDGFFKKGL